MKFVLHATKLQRHANTTYIRVLLEVSIIITHIKEIYNVIIHLGSILVSHEIVLRIIKTTKTAAEKALNGSIKAAKNSKIPVLPA